MSEAQNAKSKYQAGLLRAPTLLNRGPSHPCRARCCVGPEECSNQGRLPGGGAVYRRCSVPAEEEKRIKKSRGKLGCLTSENPCGRRDRQLGMVSHESTGRAPHAQCSAETS